MSWESKGKRGEAPFRGHPPSSVDEHICNDIRSRLADDPGIDSSDIKVRVEDGQVLFGGIGPERNCAADGRDRRVRSRGRAWGRKFARCQGPQTI